MINQVTPTLAQEMLHAFASAVLATTAATATVGALYFVQPQTQRNITDDACRSLFQPSAKAQTPAIIQYTAGVLSCASALIAPQAKAG